MRLHKIVSLCILLRFRVCTESLRFELRFALRDWMLPTVTYTDWVTPPALAIELLGKVSSNAPCIVVRFRVYGGMKGAILSGKATVCIPKLWNPTTLAVQPFRRSFNSFSGSHCRSAQNPNPALAFGLRFTTRATTTGSFALSECSSNPTLRHWNQIRSGSSSSDLISCFRVRLLWMANITSSLVSCFEENYRLVQAITVLLLFWDPEAAPFYQHDGQETQSSKGKGNNNHRRDGS